MAGTTSYAAWAASTAYAVNAEVTYSGKAYYCKTAHTSGSSWDSSKWTAIATPVLKGTVSGVTELYAGMKIAYKWPITGGSSSTYLNINNLGNVYIRRNDSNTTTHLPANTVSILTYDGTYWRWADYDSNSNTEYIIPDAYCSTAAGTAAKAATCVGFNLTNHVNVPFRIYFTVANTSAGALTLSLNSQTAKPIYINGTASSASNYTIPIGVYWCVYDGTEFLLWTDKRFTGRTQGDGRNLLSAFNYNASRFTPTNPSDDINGASYTHNKVTGDSYIQIKATEPIATGEMLTLSFDVSGLNTSGNEYASFLAYALNKVITHTINKNGRCVYYFTKTETADITTGSVVNILDDNTNIYASAPSGITISNIKLERGFVADPKYTRHPSESRVAKADKIAASAKIGDTNKPVYIAADGTVTAGSTYAAGTAVTLNGTSKSATTASFYAPTGAGTSGQLLQSSGSGAPTWSTANAALVGITVTSTSVSDGTNTFNKYTHPTTSGNKHVPSGGSSGQFLGWSADGTAAWVANPNTDTKVTSSANHYTPATASGSDKTASASGATAAWSIDVVKGVTLNTDGKGHVTGLSVTSGKIPANPNTDTKVTSAANHYTPETASGSDKTASASGATAAWSIDVVKGVTLNTDGKGHVTGLSVTSGKIPANPNTDTKVTSSANHYTPATATGSDVSASASGATAAWSIDVVKGVTLNTDGKGHVTGMSVTSGKIPGNPNTDTKQRIVASSAKTYLTGVTTAPTSSNQDLTGVASTKVYATDGVLTATSFSGNLTGNVTGNCSGDSGSCTGNAATATTATNANKVLQKLDDNTATGDYYVLHSGTTSLTTSGSNSDVYGRTGVSIQPSTGRMSAVSYRINSMCTMQYNSSTMSVDFVF